jgi:hypothetical protein
MDITSTRLCGLERAIFNKTESGNALEAGITETGIVFIDVAVIPFYKRGFLNNQGFVETLAGSTPCCGKLDTYPWIAGGIETTVDRTTGMEERFKEHVVWEGSHL